MEGLFSLILISITLTILSHLVGRALSNREMIEKIRKEMKEIKKELEKVNKSSNPEKFWELLSKLLALNFESVKYSYKGLIASSVIVITSLPFIAKKYSGMLVKIPLIGIQLNWIAIYLIASLFSSIIIRKLVG